MDKEYNLPLAFIVFLLIGLSFVCMLVWYDSMLPAPETSTPTVTFVRVTATPSPTMARLTSAPTATPSPTASLTPTPWPTATPSPSATSSPTATPTVTPSPTATLAAGCVIEPGSLYTIRRGDTLWHIADCAYGQPTWWPVIYHANPQLSNPSRIHAGNTLIIPHEGRWTWHE